MSAFQYLLHMPAKFTVLLQYIKKQDLKEKKKKKIAF